LIDAGADARKQCLETRSEAAETLETLGSPRIRLRWRAAGKTDKELPMTDDDAGEGPVVVKRAVYDAGMKLEAEVDEGGSGPAFSNAEDKATSCRAAGDMAGAAFWDKTFRFLMTRECVAAGTKTLILEEGETYDYDGEKVIRPGTNQPRSDKDYR